MQFDRKITISAGSSRRAMVWQAQTLLISELWAKLQTPARGTEPLAEYLNMKKAQQDDLKDVGGFMAGTLSGPRRKANNVTGRDVITLDLDNIPPGGTEDVLRRVEGLSCGYCIYSTRKHSPAAPRLRVLLPLDRTASADEYEPIARKMAEYIGLELCDPTTFEVSRLMYWPSCCSDSQYIYVWKDKPLLSVKGLLGRQVLYTARQEGRVLTLDVPDCAATFRTTIQDMKTLMNQGVSTLVLTTEKGSTTLNLSLLCEGQTDTQRVVLRQLGGSAFLTVGLRCRRDLIVGR